MAQYYTLVASLPRLPYFESAEWLPLSLRQLEERMSMLEPADREQLRLAGDLVRWQREASTRSSEQVALRYRQVIPQMSNPSLREFVEYRMNQRTAMVALRRRWLGRPPPAAEEIWGVGPWERLMRANWDSPDLGLARLLPWIAEADQLLRAGDAMALERVLMDAVWTRLGRIAERRPFGFEPVFAFVFRWDIVQRWMSYDAGRGKLRFQELVTEVMREQEQLFA